MPFLSHSGAKRRPHAPARAAAGALRAIGRVATASGLATLGAFCALGGAQGASPDERLLTLASACVLAAHALAPAGPASRLGEAAAGWAWGASVCLLACATPWAWGPAGVAWPAALRPAAAAGVLVVLLLALSRLLAARGAGAEQARAATWLVAAAAWMAPVWLGPAVEAWLPHPPWTNAVVAVSPLTFLAQVTGFDYLRSAWYYRHCPLGSLRYAYPAPGVLAMAYVVLAAVAMEARRRRSPGHGRPGRHG